MLPTLVRRAANHSSHAAKGGHPVHVHPPGILYRIAGTGLGASMWFFLMYRAKEDGPALLGWKHPWDH